MCPPWRGLQRDITAGAAYCWHRQHPGHRLRAAASRAIRNGSSRISDVMHEDIDIEEVAFPLHCRTSPITVRAANGRTLVWKSAPRSRSPTSPLRTSGGRAGPGRGEVRLRDGGAVLGGRAPLHEHCHRKHNHSAVTTQSAHRYSTVTAVKQREEVRGCWVLCVRRYPHCLPTLTTGGKTGP